MCGRGWGGERRRSYEKSRPKEGRRGERSRDVRGGGEEFGNEEERDQRRAGGRVEKRRGRGVSEGRRREG